MKLDAVWYSTLLQHQQNVQLSGSHMQSSQTLQLAMINWVTGCPVRPWKWYQVNTLGGCLQASSGIHLEADIWKSLKGTGRIRLSTLRDAFLWPLLDELWDTLQSHDWVSSDMHLVIIIILTHRYTWMAWSRKSRDALGVHNPKCLRINLDAMI